MIIVIAGPTRYEFNEDYRTRIVNNGILEVYKDGHKVTYKDWDYVNDDTYRTPPPNQRGIL